MKLPMSSVTGNSAPTSSEAAWSETFPSWNTVKAARSLGNGNVACLLWGEEKQASVVMLSASGASVWGPKDYHTQHGEATDLQVAADGSSLFLSGHGKERGVGYYARLTKIDAADGSRAWTETYTAGGNPRLIFNECWGVVVMGDGGLTLACGTGIEDCTSQLSDEDRADCNQGRGDTRANALPRAAGVWQSLVIHTDAAGKLLWQRVDSFKASEAPELDASSEDERTSSAAEWAFLTSDGGLAVVMDEVGGVGLMKLRANATFQSSHDDAASSTDAGPNDGTASSTSMLSPVGMSCAWALAFAASVA